MAEFDIDVSELEAMAQRLRDISGTGATAFAGIAQKYGFLTKAEAIRLAPFKTGELRASIRSTKNESSGRFTSSEWEVTARHAMPIEYGFVHYRSRRFVGPFPYVRPALNKYRKPYIEELAASAKQQFGTLKKVSRPLLNATQSLSDR